MVVRRRVVVSGEVQGVFFRDTCRRVAVGEGVGGFVRNLPDGRVEACLEGEDEAVSRVVEWCRKGPSYARVTGVEVTDEEPRGDRGFEIR